MFSVKIKRFRHDDRGLTLIETSFYMFFLALMMVNGTEIDRYARFVRHLGFAAEGIGVLMSQHNAPMGNADWSGDTSALVWLYPEVVALSGQQWRDALGVQTTLVRFVPSDPACTENCTYTRAQVLWTWSGGTEGSRALLDAKGVLRTCGLLEQGTETPAAQSLPANLFQNGQLLVVTLVYAYKPYFKTSFIGERRIVREAYVVPTGDLDIDPFGMANEVVPCP